MDFVNYKYEVVDRYYPSNVVKIVVFVLQYLPSTTLRIAFVQFFYFPFLSCSFNNTLEN